MLDEDSSMMINSSSVFNGMMKDLDNIKVAVTCDNTRINHQQSFQIEFHCQRNDGQIINANQIENSISDKDNKEGSFTMTHRESNIEINSNNLFETLNENLNKYNHQMVVNQNDYVSFNKQLSNKKSITNKPEYS